MVNHGHFLVNGKKVNIPSYRVQPGDVISVREKSRGLTFIKESLEARNFLPNYITFNDNAMARHPKVFSRLYIAMVEAGEAAGILDIVLDRVAVQIEKQEAIRRRVKGAMIYPALVMVFATVILIAMLMFLIPIFVKIFDQLGGQLPMLTQMVLHVSNLLRGYCDEIGRDFVCIPILVEVQLVQIAAGHLDRPGGRLIGKG